MNINSIRIFPLLLTVTALTLHSCNNEENQVPQQNGKRLSITVGVDAPQSRGIITDNKLPDGDEHSIGILLDGYDDVNNIKFTPSTQEGNQVWTPAKDIWLTAIKGTLYAYYPYKVGTSLEEIAVETATQTDYMYATPLQGLTENKADVTISLKHMLTNAHISIVRDTYVGDGNISSITIQSDGLATGGTFNAAQLTPAFTAVTGTGDAITQAVNTTLGGTATNIMVVPTGTSKTITFTVSVDGRDYTATTSELKLEEGISYSFTLKMHSTFLTINSVSVSPVTPWDPITNEEKLPMDKA